MEPKATSTHIEEEKQETSKWPFIASLLSYYKEFLETDFQGRHKPKRKIQLSIDEGVSGVQLNKYPKLNSYVLDLLSKNFSVPKLAEISDGEFAIYPEEVCISKINEVIIENGSLESDKVTESVLDSFELWIESEKLNLQPNLLYSRAELRNLLKESTVDKYTAIIRKYRLFDLYRDITLILQTKKLTDKTEFYLYFYDIKFDSDSYPLFFIPVNIEHARLTEIPKPAYKLEMGPVLYINEKALQYISEKITGEENRDHRKKIDIPKRQFYWNEETDLPSTINGILNKISNLYQLPHFSLNDKEIKFQNEKVKISSNCYMTVSDKSDEALINDYEALQLLLEGDSSLAREIFDKLINQFLLENPKVVTLEVDEEFNDLSVSEKLTYKSPIPLNSEQIKILEALRKDEVKSVIIEGPPGTGKSHTITAIIYDALLNNKSVLVTSDKKEALDVVEEKIIEALEKVKIDEGYVQNPILRLGQAETNFNKIFQNQNFEKIKDRYSAHKFNQEKLASQITDRTKDMQDGINEEIINSKEFHEKILPLLPSVIDYEKKHLSEWRDTLDINEISEDNNYKLLEEIIDIREVLQRDNKSYYKLSTGWLADHTNDEDCKNIDEVLRNLETIEDLGQQHNNYNELIQISKNIVSKTEYSWENILLANDKFTNISNQLMVENKNLITRKIEEILVLEKLPSVIVEIEQFVEILNKCRSLYNLHISKYGKKIFLDINDNNINNIEEYLENVKKLKSFLWQFTKKSEIEKINNSLEIAFPESKLVDPHSIIPHIESEVVICKEIQRLRDEFKCNYLDIKEVLSIKNIENLFKDDTYNGTINNLQTLTTELKEISRLIQEESVLETCKQVVPVKDVSLNYLEINKIAQSVVFLNVFEEVFDSCKKLELNTNPIFSKYLEKIGTTGFLNSQDLKEFITEFNSLKILVEFVKSNDRLIERIINICDNIPLTCNKLSVVSENLESLLNEKITTLNEEKVRSLINYLEQIKKIEEVFGKNQYSTYNVDTKLLQNRFIAQMTYILDKKVVEFRTFKAGEAEDLKKLIKLKSQLPKKLIRVLIEAFPCLIVNIRELGEFLPLEPELFDVVIIDEASQVSIAQAFPALLRAKKVVVLGDVKQFSNVKTSNASKAINNEAFSNVKENFKKDSQLIDNETRDAIKEKIYRFDIRNSILEFIRNIANYQTMLRKHFRGYKEVISYSNKYFYSNQLQVMKLRARGINEVIRFEIVEDSSEPIEVRGNAGKIIENANKNEAEFIRNELEQKAESGSKESVGVITPFRNQQKYIADLLRNSPKFAYMDEIMNLKVMTFDTCQGEERDTVYYSMVESKSNSSRLNTIFAKALSLDDDEGKLREQRLNVGFSRVKECAVFVISKPVEEFTGEIGNAIKHFKGELEESSKLPDPSETESEGEKRLLSLIQQTKFYDENKDYLDIKAQFPIGEYLRRINNAEIPAYRVDFLMTYCKPDEKPTNVIIEYDGFEFHFKDGYEIKNNFDDFYIAQDIERQKALETYGYEFLRVNKFVLGNNPIESLDHLFDVIVKKKPKKTHY